MKLAYKIDSNDTCIQNEITRITEEYLRICNANVPKTISVVDDLVDDDNAGNCEQKMKIMENFISTITEKKKSKKQNKIEKKKNEEAQIKENIKKSVDLANKQDLINEEEQEWSDLEEEKDEFEINENDFEVTFEINPNAVIPEEIKELGRFFH